MTVTKTKTENFHDRQIRKVQERIKKDIVNHTIKVIQNRGVHRHYLCKSPGTSNYWFEVITWPGGLTINGDMGTYTFTRTEDMIAFMRNSAMSFSYAKQKCRSESSKINEFREEQLIESMEDAIEYAEENEDFDRVAKLKELMEEIQEYGENNSYNDYKIYEMMYESDLFDCDMPNCEAYTMSFLWNLYAIKWLCDRVKDYRPRIWTRAWHGLRRLVSQLPNIDYAGD